MLVILTCEINNTQGNWKIVDDCRFTCSLYCYTLISAQEQYITPIINQTAWHLNFSFDWILSGILSSCNLTWKAVRVSLINTSVETGTTQPGIPPLFVCEKGRERKTPWVQPPACSNCSMNELLISWHPTPSHLLHYCLVRSFEGHSRPP